jgi:hypothetical protein
MTTTTPTKQIGPRPPGRPYGSTSKGKGRKVLFGKQNQGQWHQGEFELEPDVSMVCLAAVDKETGYAERGGYTLPLSPVTASAHIAHTRRESRDKRGSEGTLSSSRPPLTPASPSPFTHRKHRRSIAGSPARFPSPLAQSHHAPPHGPTAAPHLHLTCTSPAPHLHLTCTSPAPHLHLTCTSPTAPSPLRLRQRAHPREDPLGHGH